MFAASRAAAVFKNRRVNARRLALIAGAIGLLAAFAPPAPQAKAGQFNDGQKQEIETIVHDYLLAHPEVLRDVSVELEKRQKLEEADSRGRAIAEHGDALYRSKFQAVVGDPNGKIVLVEFFDYNCGYCKRALEDLANLMKQEPSLRVVLKDFPVLGPNSVEAAQVASAARMQLPGQKFWQFHQKLLLSHGPVGKAQALSVAKDLGLDMDRLDKDMKDPSIRAGLEEIMKIGDTLNLTGTPSYVLGDEVIVGAVGYDQLKAKVDSIGKCGKTTC